MTARLTIALLLSSTLALTPAPGAPIPARFDSRGADRRAIEALLEAYTRAVSTKDQALFETLLLGTDIPFSGVQGELRAGSGARDVRSYGGFRDDVFKGAPFLQRFRNVRIEQDGPLAQVSLVFVNTSRTGTSWGWKTLQLLKVGGRWKIASEFYTGHPG